MAVQRSSAENLSTARTRVRAEVNDSDSASQRWSDSEIDRSVLDTVRFLMREKSNRDPGELLLYTELPYSGKWTSLGSTVGSASVVKVEVIDDPDNPTQVEYVPITVLETIKGDIWSSPVKVYSLSGGTGGTDRMIGIRSDSEEAFDIRIWYLDEAITPTGDSDDMPLQPVWMRLVQLHAAKALRAVEGEWTIQQESNLQEMLHLWKMHRQAGGPRIIPTRRRN